MKRTQNYQLSQWEKTDRIQMEIFNEDNLKMDEALKVQKNELEVLVAAMALKGNCQMEVFSYVGNGGGENTISFPRMPAFFLIRGSQNGERAGLLMGLGGEASLFEVLKQGSLYDDHPLEMNGVRWDGSQLQIYHNTTPAYCMNVSGVRYTVIAFYMN